MHREHPATAAFPLHHVFQEDGVPGARCTARGPTTIRERIGAIS